VLDIWGSRVFQEQVQLAQFRWEPPLDGKPTKRKRLLRLITDDGKILGTIIVKGREIQFPDFLTLEVSRTSDHVAEPVQVPLHELTRDTLRQRISEALRL